MITNNYLFASQFLNYLASLKIADEDQFNAFKNTIHNFFNKETSTSDSESFITLAISLLGFSPESPKSFNESEFSKYFLLHQGAPIERYPVVSCLYFIQDNIDLNSCEKGLFPSFELINLLRQNNIEWGILTNGKVWRLYSTLSALPYEYFIEINFENAQDLDYKVFWQLFTVHLFIPDENEITPLEKFIEESDKESQLIEKHIKANIDGILENITMGFITYSDKLNKELSDQEKQEYFDNSVYLLFRLLFVFYAESRGLLPIKNSSYFEISLENLLLKAKRWIENGIPDSNATELWDSFRDLCSDIDTGNYTAQIPEYDGGLFAIDEHKFLNDPQNKITDSYFTKILVSLGFYKKGKREIKIEYRDLSVRSIGSLYEGILEYKLFLAEEDLFLRGDKIIPKRLAGNQKKTDKLVNKGSVYFSQDADERHDTGSYYTPEDVVNYMVQNSVRIALEDKWIKFLPSIQKYERELKQTAKDSYRLSILNKFDNELLLFVEEQILNFKVIDPTMGSGHFLVNSLNTITNFIVEALQTNVKIGNGQIKHKEEIIEINWSLFYHHNHSINLEPSYWRRKVVERCIFGIDINPLAAELAKLSLWIASSSYGKPLAFINHHIKCGDAIIGAKLEDVFKYPEFEISSSQEINIFEKIKEDKITDLKNKFDNLFHFDSDIMENIRKKKGIFDEIEANPFLNRLKDVSTLWLMISYALKGNSSFSFMNALSLIDSEKYYQIIESIDKVNTNEEWKNVLNNSLYEEIQGCKNKHRIFHWDLEFSEIISEGFDVVVGNPPYVDINSSVYKGVNLKTLNSLNLYGYIIERSISHIKNLSSLSFVIPVTFSCSKKMKELRNYVLEKINISYISHYSDRPSELFIGVRQRLNILIGIKNPGEKEIYSSNYLRWESRSRKKLFQDISYSNVKNSLIKSKIPKCGDNVGIVCLNTLLSCPSKISNIITNTTDYKIYYQRVACYWIKAFNFIPEYSSNGVSGMSSTTSSFNVDNNFNCLFSIIILNSSIFYWWWTMISDGFDVTMDEILNFPLPNMDNISERSKQELENIANHLMTGYKNSNDYKSMKVSGKLVKIQSIEPFNHKEILYEIDKLLSYIYNLDFNYITSIDRKYRYK